MRIIEPPTITGPHISASETREVWNISIQLSSMAGYVRNFEAGVALFEFASAGMSRPNVSPQFAELCAAWVFVAARDGAMTIYHFTKAMEGIRASFRNCPDFRSLVDHSKLRSATKTFDQFFPNCEGMRHAVAHAAELRRDAENAARNSFTGTYEGPGVYVSGIQNTVNDCLTDRTFTTTWEGQIINYDLSAESIERLTAVAGEFFSGFAGAERPNPFSRPVSEPQV